MLLELREVGSLELAPPVLACDKGRCQDECRFVEDWREEGLDAFSLSRKYSRVLGSYVELRGRGLLTRSPAEDRMSIRSSAELRISSDVLDDATVLWLSRGWTDEDRVFADAQFPPECRLAVFCPVRAAAARATGARGVSTSKERLLLSTSTGRSLSGDFSVIVPVETYEELAVLLAMALSSGLLVIIDCARLMPDCAVDDGTSFGRGLTSRVGGEISGGGRDEIGATECGLWTGVEGAGLREDANAASANRSATFVFKSFWGRGEIGPVLSKLNVCWSRSKENSSRRGNLDESSSGSALRAAAAAVALESKAANGSPSVTFPGPGVRDGEGVGRPLLIGVISGRVCCSLTGADEKTAPTTGA